MINLTESKEKVIMVTCHTTLVGYINSNKSIIYDKGKKYKLKTEPNSFDQVYCWVYCEDGFYGERFIIKGESNKEHFTKYFNHPIVENRNELINELLSIW